MSESLGEKHKTSVLVVDDEQLIADSLAWILCLVGFDARSVYSGSDAINHAVLNPIDILISDVVMHGMSGIDSAIEICKLFPKCKVLLLSGNIETSDMLRSAWQNRSVRTR